MGSHHVRSKHHRLYCILLTALLNVTITGSCGGGSGESATALSTPPQPSTSRQYAALNTELAKLEVLPTPAGVDEAIFSALKAELACMLKSQGVARFVSAPPMNEGSSTQLNWSEDSSALTWRYCCIGDYNQNSLVEVADITPLGVNWQQQSPNFPAAFEYIADLSVVDGNCNGMIEIADITPIGQNYQVRVAAYNVYASPSLSDYPTDPGSGNGGAARLGSVPFPEEPPPAGQRRMFSFIVEDPQPETYLWVRPTDGSSEGTPSNYYYLTTPANVPPVASLTADPLAGDPPLTVAFDASLSHDPDGEIVAFEWDWDGAENGWEWEDTGTTAIQQHEYPEGGNWAATVRVTDNEGEKSSVSVQISVTMPNAPPEAVLRAQPESGIPPLTVTFNAEDSTDSDGEIVNYEWDLDDDDEFNEPGEEAALEGSTSTEITYDSAGWYKVWVRVTDNEGATNKASARVDVDAPTRGDWWMYGHDPQHTRRSPYAGPTTANLQWEFDCEGYVHSSPAIGSDGTIYVGAQVDKFYALNPDGTLKWCYPQEGDPISFNSSPAIGEDGTVYVGAGDSQLYAFNPGGSVKWTFPTEGGMGSSPVIAPDGTIYTGCGDGNVYAVNADGSLKWSFAAGEGVGSSPALALDGTIYVGSRDNRIYAIKPNGSQKWSYPTGDDVASSPAIGEDGTIYVGSNDYSMYAINPDGSLKWSYPTEDMVDCSPALAAGGTIYFGSWDRNFYALNPDGSLKWRIVGLGRMGDASPAVDANGVIYMGCWNWKFVAINPDGTLKWGYDVGGQIAGGSPAIAPDGTVYIGCMPSIHYWYMKVYAFGPDGL